MAIKNLRPTTNGQRNMSVLKNNFIKKKPEKSLIKIGKKITGRSRGTISVRHRGGGTRPKYRIIDFNGTDKLGIVAKISSIEYDTNRSANIALAVFSDGEKRYILAHKNLQVGNEFVTDKKAKIVDGNRMEIQNIPIGFPIFNIELIPNCGGKIVRSAGNFAKIISLDGEKAQIELPSKEIRLIPKKCFATIGTVSNEEKNLVKIGKAGRVRNSGRRPQVRGKAMNPCDHPHGGGEGGSPIGMKYPKTPWGAHALGVKTRKKKKQSNKFIVLSRHRAKK